MVETRHVTFESAHNCAATPEHRNAVTCVLLCHIAGFDRQYNKMTAKFSVSTDVHCKSQKQLSDIDGANLVDLLHD